MTGRLRNLRPFWSRRSIPSSGTPYRATADDIEAANWVLQATRERDAAVQALEEMRDGLRSALLTAGYFHPGPDLVVDVKHMAGEYVKSVADYRSLNARHERLRAGGSDYDRAKLISAVESYDVRSGRSTSADLAQERANNTALVKRLEELREAYRILELEVARLQDRSTEQDWTGSGSIALRPT